MTAATADLDTLVRAALDATGDVGGEAASAETTMRERFFELMVLILGNLYTKTPVAAALFDRGTLLRITEGMDDNEAGRLASRTEDWLRLEGLLRQQDGAKAYFITRGSIAVLTTATSGGDLGDVMDKILQSYKQAMPSEKLRSATRQLGAYFLNHAVKG
jgi:hypothetical protein